MLSILAYAALAGAAPTQCERAGWDKLSMLQGQWDVSFSFRRAPGQFEEGTARSVVTEGASPCTLIDQVSGEMAGKPIQFVSVVTITPAGSVERSYMDSEHGRLLHYTGDISGAVVRLRLDHPTAGSFLARAEMDLRDPQKPLMTHFLSTDGGNEWQPVLIFRYRAAARYQPANGQGARSPELGL